MDSNYCCPSEKFWVSLTYFLFLESGSCIYTSHFCSCIWMCSCLYAPVCQCVRMHMENRSCYLASSSIAFHRMFWGRSLAGAGAWDSAKAGCQSSGALLTLLPSTRITGPSPFGTYFFSMGAWDVNLVPHACSVVLSLWKHIPRTLPIIFSLNTVIIFSHWKDKFHLEFKEPRQCNQTAFLSGCR